MKWRKFIFIITIISFIVLIILFAYKRWYIPLYSKITKVVHEKPSFEALPVLEASHPYKYYRDFYTTCRPVFKHTPEQKYIDIDKGQLGKKKIIIESLPSLSSLILNVELMYKGPRTVKFMGSLRECVNVTLEDERGSIRGNDYEIKFGEIQKYIHEAEDDQHSIVIKSTKYNLNDISKLEPLAGLRTEGEILLKGDKIFEVDNVYKVICVIDLRCMNPVYENGEILEERYRKKIGQRVEKTEVEFITKEKAKKQWIEKKEKEAEEAKKEGDMRRYYQIKAWILLTEEKQLEAIDYLKKALKEEFKKPINPIERGFAAEGRADEYIMGGIAHAYYFVCNFEESIKWFEKYGGEPATEKSTWYLFRDRAYIGAGKEKELLERQIRLGVPEKEAKEYIERLKFNLNKHIEECKRKGYIK